MKKGLKITLITIFTIIVIVSLTAIAQANNKNPKVILINRKLKPNSVIGQTLPPFVILVNKNVPISKERPEGYLSVIKHEKIHWMQWQREGLLPFWYHYFIEFVKNGHKNNKYEIEARKLSGENY